MRKLGVSTIADSLIPIEEQIRMIKACGFDCFFTSLYEDEPIGKWKELSEKLGLLYETVHLPFHIKGGLNANHLWLDTPEGEEYYNYILKRIDVASEALIPIGVMHVTCGSEGPGVTELGLERFKKMCDYAEGKNVRLAFENLECPEYLYRVMEIAGEFHGFCWDIGHNLCYTPEIDMSEKYGNRIICTHIHDNFGVTKPGNIHWYDDLHMLPFDGKLDWEWYGKRIKETGYKGPLTSELLLKSKDEYKNQPLEEFFKSAYDRLAKIRELVE